MAKQNLGMFLCKFTHFGLVFSDMPPYFYVYLPVGFVFLNFLTKRTLGLYFSVKLRI